MTESDKIFKKGEYIDMFHSYKVLDFLGGGGFGLVYLVASNRDKKIYAFKSLRDEFKQNSQVQERFKNECHIWISLDSNPYLVRAYAIENIICKKLVRKLFIILEYVKPDKNGINSLEGYLKHKPPNLNQSLRWAIQICYGMEYAYSKGIKAHRDIKPSNILISNGENVKVADFGLAGIVKPTKTISGIKLSIHNDKVGCSYQTREGVGFGTPYYMSPEQFTNAEECNESSDIYSFGIVLYQMATEGNLPFVTSLPKDDSEKETIRFWNEMYMLHRKTPVPKIISPLSPIIYRCLEKSPIDRYFTFKDIRRDLELLLKKQTGEFIIISEKEDISSVDWHKKGRSLDTLGKFHEAIDCFNKGLNIDVKNADLWLYKGDSLMSIGKYQDAIDCYDKVLEINSIKCESAKIALTRKARVYKKLNNHKLTMTCFDKMIEIDPNDGSVWYDKAELFLRIGNHKEAISCYDRSIEITAMDTESCELGLYSMRCEDKAKALNDIGKYQEAITYYNKAIENNPFPQAAWFHKGVALINAGKKEEGRACLNKALELSGTSLMFWFSEGWRLLDLGCYKESLMCFDQIIAINPSFEEAWHKKGIALYMLDKYRESIVCFNEILEINLSYVNAYYSKGKALIKVGKHIEAVDCYNRALEINPMYIEAWYNKGIAEDHLGLRQAAMYSYKNFIDLNPPQYAKQIEYARKRLRESERSCE